MFISLPLILFPAHTILEIYLFGEWPNSPKRENLKNLHRAVLVAFLTIFTIALGDKLDKFVSVLGALANTPTAFLLPALFHFKVCAETPLEKAKDMTIVVFSFIIMIYGTYQGIHNWNL